MEEDVESSENTDGILFRKVRRGGYKRKRPVEGTEDAKDADLEKKRKKYNAFLARLSDSAEIAWKSTERLVHSELDKFISNSSGLENDEVVPIITIATPLCDRQFFMRRLYLKLVTLRRYTPLVIEEGDNFFDKFFDERKAPSINQSTSTAPENTTVVVFRRAERVLKKDFSRIVHYAATSASIRIALVFVTGDGLFQIPLVAHEMPGVRILHIALPHAQERLNKFMVAIAEPFFVFYREDEEKSNDEDDSSEILIPDKKILKFLAHEFIESTGSMQKTFFLLRYMLFCHFMGSKNRLKVEEKGDSSSHSEKSPIVTKENAQSFFRSICTLYKVILPGLRTSSARIDFFSHLVSLPLLTTEKEKSPNIFEILKEAVISAPIMVFREISKKLEDAIVSSSVFSEEDINSFKKISKDVKISQIADRNRRISVFRLLSGVLENLRYEIYVDKVHPGPLIEENIAFRYLDDPAALVQSSFKLFRSNSEFGCVQSSIATEKRLHEYVRRLMIALLDAREDFSIKTFKMDFVYTILKEKEGDSQSLAGEKAESVMRELIHAGIVKKMRSGGFRLNYFVKTLGTWSENPRNGRE